MKELPWCRHTKGVDIGDDRLPASIEQPVLITRCVFHTLLQEFTGKVFISHPRSPITQNTKG